MDHSIFYKVDISVVVLVKLLRLSISMDKIQNVKKIVGKKVLYLFGIICFSRGSGQFQTQI